MMRVSMIGLLLTLSSIPSVLAATVAGVTMPDTITVDGTNLVLNGMGLRQATALRVKAYVGGLYLEHRTSDGNTVIDSPQVKRVTMGFVRDIDSKRLTSGWADEIRKVGNKIPDDKIAQFSALIPDVKDGDKMSFTWRPGAGVDVALNDKPRGSVPGDDFARTLFTVWFGPKPGDENLKRGMLGK